MKENTYLFGLKTRLLTWREFFERQNFTLNKQKPSYSILVLSFRRFSAKEILSNVYSKDKTNMLIGVKEPIVKSTIAIDFQIYDIPLFKKM